MAQFAPERVAEILRTRGLATFTERTIADPARLAEELAAIRARGWAVDDEEHTGGMRCVAAAIFDEHSEPVAGLSVSGPAARLTPERAAAIGATVRRRADQVTAAIGGKMVAPGA